MNFTSESVMHDIEMVLKKRSEKEWSNTDRVLLKAQLHIASLQRQLDHKDLTDEEIQQAIDGIDWNQSNVLIRFAKAILRKAQEQ
jgi:hypothetical protein